MPDKYRKRFRENTDRRKKQFIVWAVIAALALAGCGKAGTSESEASVVKGTNQMADKLQTVYIIPAHDGCLVATERCFIEESEGFGRRFGYMLNTLSVLD